jgi:rhodanese-related sulfurtransferase
MRALLPCQGDLLLPVDRLLEYMSHHPWLATATAVLAAFIVVYELRAHSERGVSVSPQEAIRLMNQGALLLDLRALELYQAGHVAGARRMGSDEILRAADTLKKHKEKVVVVYDDSGSLSGAAARQLTAQGFTRAVALRGGLAAWRADNLPVTRG